MKHQTIYFYSPVFLQNIIVSAYGFYLKHKRYSGEYQKIFEQVQHFKTLSPSLIQEYQNEQFLKMLNHCYYNVPYYQKLFKLYKLKLKDFRSIEDINKIPILTKEIARKNQKKLLAENITYYWKQHTSGSTGTPLTVFLDKYTYMLYMAMLASYEAMYGVEPNDPIATFAGRMVQRVGNHHLPFWRYNLADNQMLFSSYHLSDTNLPLYLKKLEMFQPKEIIGYPSAIYTIAEFCNRTSTYPKINPCVIITNSEILFSWQRAIIEKAFNCPVADYYGSAECLTFAPQCHEGAYHFNPLLSIIELLQNGSSTPFGEQGKLILTTLTNYVMPLLRYEIGDDAVMDESRCPCGLKYPSTPTIVGRTDDNIITPDGCKIGRLDHIFKGLQGIRECQIIQERLDQITLNIVQDEAFDKTQRSLLIKNLKERIGDGFNIRINSVLKIERRINGKFKGVICKIKASDQETPFSNQITCMAR